MLRFEKSTPVLTLARLVTQRCEKYESFAYFII